jgi:hypothetical protein
MAVITGVLSRAATTALSPRRRTSITDSRRDYGQTTTTRPRPNQCQLNELELCWAGMVEDEE